MTDPTETTRQLLRRAESYLSALHGSVARHDNLAANLGCAGCELRDQIRGALAAPAAVPPTTALRDRIAAALYERERPPCDPHWPDVYASDREVFEAMADAVLGVLPAGSEDTTTTQAAVALRDAADFYDQLLTDMGTDVSCDPRYWTAVRDIVRGLRCRADEAQQQPEASAAHSCGNCEGEDPDTCWTNPDRPPEPCPAAEFGDYGQQCGKPVGHELHTFEEQPAAVQTDEEA